MIQTHKDIRQNVIKLNESLQSEGFNEGSVWQILLSEEKNQFTKESEDQSEEQTHHEKGGHHVDVGQDGRDLPSLLIVIFYQKCGVVIIPGISLDGTSRTTVTPLPPTHNIFPIFTELCWTPGLNRFLDFHL